jgi:hypothetical protein
MFCARESEEAVRGEWNLRPCRCADVGRVVAPQPYIAWLPSGSPPVSIMHYESCPRLRCSDSEKAEESTSPRHNHTAIPVHVGETRSVQLLPSKLSFTTREVSGWGSFSKSGWIGVAGSTIRLDRAAYLV